VGSEIGATIEVFNRSAMEWTAVDVVQKERLRVAMGVVEYQGNILGFRQKFLFTIIMSTKLSELYNI